MSRTRYARSGALRIAYERRGILHWRRPWLVLIQGMGMDRLGWEPVLRKLRRHFRLVLVDNRGSGHSDRPAGSITVADMAGDVRAGRAGRGGAGGPGRAGPSSRSREGGRVHRLIPRRSRETATGRAPPPTSIRRCA